MEILSSDGVDKNQVKFDYSSLSKAKIGTVATEDSDKLERYENVQNEEACCFGFTLPTPWWALRRVRPKMTSLPFVREAFQNVKISFATEKRRRL